MLNLPDTILTTMRSAVESLMTDICTLAAAADVVGEMGEVLNDQYAVVATGVACRVILVSLMQSERAGSLGEREVILEAYRLVVPYGTAIAVDQRVTLDSDRSVWQIVDLDTARTSKVDKQAVIVRVHG